MLGTHSETRVGRVDFPATRLPAVRSDPNVLRLRNQAILPLAETMETRGLRALARTSRERALVSRLELTAFQQGAHAFEFADAGADASTALWFRTRQFGLPVGVIEGLTLRSASAAEWALHI